MNQCQTQSPHVIIEPVVLAGSPTALPENIEPSESLKKNQTILYFSLEKDQGGGWSIFEDGGWVLTGKNGAKK